jgi:hypothetical protein
MFNKLTFTTNTKKGAGHGSRHLEPVLYGDAVPTLAATIRQTTPAFTAGGEHNEFYLNRYTVLMYMFIFLLAYAPTKVVLRRGIANRQAHLYLKFYIYITNIVLYFILQYN